MRCCRSALIVASALVAVSAAAQAVDVDVRAPGVTVVVGPDSGPGAAQSPQNAKPAEPAYWIGLTGGAVSPELRLHLGLKDEGVIVRSVVEGGPAEKAGLAQYDILLRANQQPVTGMRVLVDEVAAAGPRGESVAIDLIRAGKQETVAVKPVERPAGVAENAGNPRGFNLPAGVVGPPGLNGPGFRMRVLGPGMQAPALGPAVQMLQQLGATSVSVSSINGERVATVQRNGETWRIDPDDPEQLATLPEDVRPAVERMLKGGGPDMAIDIEGLMSGLPGVNRPPQGDGTPLRDRLLQRRRERLQRQVEQLQHQLGVVADEAAPPGAGGEAPAFERGEAQE